MTTRHLPARLVLLGCPVAHSLSPLFQDAALAAAGIALRYEPLHVEPADLEPVLRRLVRDGAAGNVTIPHKEAVAALCDRLTPLAARVGAVNTFWTEDGALVGDNTDVGGFDHLARLVLDDVQGARVAMLGAGGSAAAVVAALDGWPGASIAIHARTPERAVRLLERLGREGRVTSRMEEALDGATLVVNATPLGLATDELPVEIPLLPPGTAVADLVYRPGETAWVREARRMGHRASDGLPMLLEQGALAFERWFARPPDREAMAATVRRRS